MAGIAMAVLPWLGGCSGRSSSSGPTVTATTDERDCLVRAMYFESQRSSREGLLAVGTVVMNRVDSQRFPNTICGVVGQHRQFAPGVLTRSLDPKQSGWALSAADAVLKGERYKPAGKALHFHAASYKNPYPAKYVTVAGGNAFYLRPGRRWQKEYTGSISTASASSETGPVQSLYKRATAVVAGGQTAAPCKTTDGFGATSMACETATEGRAD
jgi:spore germination cell wall hydrolase CwlJ-like protein